MKSHLNKLLAGESLSREEARAASFRILSEDIPSEQIAALLIALRAKGESTEELLGFLDSIRATSAVFPDVPHDLLDVCGTGGDGAQTFNISTGVALVLASMEIKVAKHGNRSVSSRSGSSDVLQALQILGDENAADALNSLRENGVSFLFAPAFYPVLAKIAQVRRNIGTHTLFNALGPLLNPAPITHQLMGVYDSSLLSKCAEVLKARGVKRAFIVHGSDGLDELTLSGETKIAALEKGEVSFFTLSPSDFGLNEAQLKDVHGGGPEENAQILMDIFSGVKSPKRNLIVMNAAAGYVLSGKSTNFNEAARRVEKVLDSGSTLKLVQALKSKPRSAT